MHHRNTHALAGPTPSGRQFIVHTPVAFPIIATHQRMCATAVPCSSIFPWLHTTHLSQASCSPCHSLTADLTAHSSRQEAFALHTHTSSTLSRISQSVHSPALTTCTPSQAWTSLGPLTAQVPGGQSPAHHTPSFGHHVTAARLSGPHNHTVYSHAVPVSFSDVCRTVQATLCTYMQYGWARLPNACMEPDISSHCRCLNYHTTPSTVF